MKKSPPRNIKCPCGSKKKFKNCCINKNFSWILNDNGSYDRHIPINDPEKLSLMKKERDRFIKIYRREPTDGDLIFFDQYVDGNSEKDIEETTVSILEELNISPAYIYAYKKTGRLVTEENKKLLTDVELEEWYSAFNEYNNLSVEHQEVEKANTNGNEDIQDELEFSLYLFGMIISKYEVADSKKIEINDFIMFCITKAFKTLKSIKVQLNSGFVEDALNLLRSVYENYLHIVYEKKYPDKLEDLVVARIGIEKGTHEYSINNNGKINKRYIIERDTGKKYLGQISNYNMAESSEYEEDKVIFDKLYEKLSRFTHPDILVFNHFVNNQKFDPHNRGKGDDVIILSIFLSLLLLEQLINISLDKQMKNDIVNSVNKLKRIILNIFCDFATNKDENYVLERSIYDRVNKIRVHN